VGGSPNSVDWGKVKTPEWDKKFDSITDNKKLNSLIRDEALRMLEHRDNSDYEDLSIINATTNSLVGRSTNSRIAGETRYTESIRHKMISAFGRGELLLAVHNHPNSFVPSFDDIFSMQGKKYTKSLVIGHDGSVVIIDKVSDAFMPFHHREAMVKFMQAGNSDAESAILTLQELQKNGLIAWRRL